MVSSYPDDDLLLLSGIQHFAFCPRQWALIHVEQQWQENVRTFEGHTLHERVDDPFFTESRGAMLVCRSLPLVSYILGLYGVADVVEFHQSPEKTPATIQLPGKDGYWLLYPVEYNAANQSPMTVTQYSFALRRSVWKECWGSRWPKVRFFTVRPGDGRSLLLM
jgi:CRISPR-associated exonuclease Cas4